MAGFTEWLDHSDLEGHGEFESTFRPVAKRVKREFASSV